MPYEANEYYSTLNNTTLRRYSMESVPYNVSNLLLYSVQAQTNTTLWTRGSPLSILGNATLLFSVFLLSPRYTLADEPIQSNLNPPEVNA